MSATAGAAGALGDYEEVEHTPTMRHSGAGVKESETGVPTSGTGPRSIRAATGERALPHTS